MDDQASLQFAKDRCDGRTIRGLWRLALESGRPIRQVARDLGIHHEGHGQVRAESTDQAA